ncbi:tetraspanin family protein, putative (macronuclear) [Tetrahymena thermophila SB210]|uniref:Tetraspanin family protein, putative n=1 Tax=Tetrahymena thermophila (strain SB210) TaxID=312017 RepID=Q22W69_TETTS|nr:tetraspanin family protein, putative [Tetrahymena thermophila SB210]EAR89548.2 tetraspanin family protein, putative [Tetrahymena thermophila SB210]|eukprot:XP_001009793.2 tetraspanin family protein, putative [Tetrahymena thermophila SB210]
MYADNYVSKELSDQNCTTGPLKVANDVFDTAQQYWCKNIDLQGQTVGCPCNIQNKSQWSPADQEILSTYNGISSTGTNSVDDCVIFQQELNGNSDEVQFLKLIEETFECTGICKGDIIYYFSDINRGPTDTTQGCYIQIRDFIFHWLGLCHIYSIIAFSIELASTIFTFINFWIDKRNKQKYNNAQRIHNKEIE